MKLLFFLKNLLLINTFNLLLINTFNLNVKNTRNSIIMSNKHSFNDLFDIDNKIDRLLTEVLRLKRDKYNILSGKPGLKMINITNESSLNKRYKIIDSYNINDDNKNDDDDDIDNDDNHHVHKNPIYYPYNLKITNYNKDLLKKNVNTKVSSENFQVIKNGDMNFTYIGGYNLIKDELMQCADMLINFDKYSKFNVRTPKGLILEGPPGTGKTLLAKCFCGEINIGFIAVSGSQFQEKYVGIGSSRVRELFKLAEENKPCVIFIDEIDAIGRKRSTDDSNNNSERDSTLNELLVALDGFKSSDGIFIIGATNRVDLLDSALTRPGRIDKSIYISLPDPATRESILNIHIEGKPFDNTISIEYLIEMTQGLSGAQIENLLNEAMLLSLRDNIYHFNKQNIDIILNRILVGCQSTKKNYSDEMLYQIAIHEMGHAIVGLLSNYNKLLKVSLNLWSPHAPGFTLFESKADDDLYTKQNLISHLMVLLSGRIAEEEFFNDAISTGAVSDLENAKKLAENMIIKYGMGSKLVNVGFSDKSRQCIDFEINNLIEIAYTRARVIILENKQLIKICANKLIVDHILTPEFIYEEINMYKVNIV
jgi:cell division protease FtsH